MTTSAIPSRLCCIKLAVKFWLHWQWPFYMWYFAGLKAYIGANPAFTHQSATAVACSKVSDFSGSNGEFVDAGATDEFYDAFSADSSSEDDDSDNEVELDSKVCVFLVIYLSIVANVTFWISGYGTCAMHAIFMVVTVYIWDKNRVEIWKHGSRTKVGRDLKCCHIMCQI